jgi:hypothetical protein
MAFNREPLLFYLAKSSLLSKRQEKKIGTLRIKLSEYESAFEAKKYLKLKQLIKRPKNL